MFMLPSYFKFDMTWVWVQDDMWEKIKLIHVISEPIHVILYVFSGVSTVYTDIKITHFVISKPIYFQKKKN